MSESDFSLGPDDMRATLPAAWSDRLDVDAVAPSSSP
jgi:hypothetical protein